MEIRVSGGDALKVSMNNPARAWQGGKNSAQSRFQSDSYFSVNHVPKFKLYKSDKIFTIGSCFAREIEYKLSPMGVPLLLFNKGVERRFFESWKQPDGIPEENQLYSGVFNKYTTASIAHEVKRVLNGDEYQNDGLIEFEKDKWLPFDIAVNNRQKIKDAMLLIKSAQVVVITLGQTESWIDTETGIAMNAHPGASILRRFPNRFEFIDHSFAQSIQQIDETVSIIRQHCGSSTKIILTVSPVPFNSTFRHQDVVVCHQATKSILRTVAEELYRSYDFIDYFPSYEMVINSPKELAWEEDYMHVKGEMVRHIMNIFYENYYNSEA